VLPEPFADVSLRGLATALFGPGARPAQARVEPDEDRVFVIVGIPAGEGDEALLVITDATGRERRERAEREFIANAAHELRTPLTTITASVEVLQAGAKDDPEQRERFLAHIQRESGRLGRLVRALLVLARAQTRSEAPKLAPVRLRPLIDDVVSTLAPSEDVEVRVRCAPDLTALLERDLAEQALANLAANAVKYTEHGTVTISAAEGTEGQIVIEVSDTGAGIPGVVRDRIFDRFYRANGRDADGFGLGLAIVRQAVQAQGGTVDIDSVPGRGTVVRVTVRGVPPEAT
jgi:signal transduction histidine kinase